MSLTPAARNAGSNDLFFTFSGAGGFLFNINWFNFNGDSPAASPGPVNPAPVPAPIAGPVNPVPAPVNPTPDPQPAPGGFTQRIQAENFVAQSGVLTQATTDTGGGTMLASLITATVQPICWMYRPVAVTGLRYVWQACEAPAQLR